jgi:hypothetical protein
MARALSLALAFYLCDFFIRLNGRFACLGLTVLWKVFPCGDAFGERFFVHPDLAVSLIDQKSVPAPPWIFTDDTMKALSPGLTRGAEARPPPWPWKRQ